MKIMYLSLGMVSLGLGILGIPLPILPTTLFLLLAIACFTRSSKRFEKWLYNTKLYQTLPNLCRRFSRNKIDCQRTKEKIIIQIYVLMGISIVFAPIIWVKIVLFFLTLFITYCLFKVIPDKDG
ncbi:YbaN family protein [Streptococcus thermophilus]